jgi:TctA family transporter
MKRVIVMFGAVISLALTAGPVVAAERDARILSVTAGFRAGDTTLNSITYDPVTRTATISVTPNCYWWTATIDPETVIGPFYSSALYNDVVVTQRGETTDYFFDHAQCDVENVLVIEGLKAGPATLEILGTQLGFNLTTSESTYRVIL